MDHVVVDGEIARTVEEVGGWDNTNLMGGAVACLWEEKTGRVRVYGPDDAPALRERLLDADRISGFNIWKFDFPVIWSVPAPAWLAGDERHVSPQLIAALLPKTDDILRRIWLALGLNPDKFYPKTHGGYPLERVARSTLGVGKIGNGADAPKWYQAGLVQKVVNYCADDVAIERDLATFIDRYGYVLRDGDRIDIAPWQGGR